MKYVMELRDAHYWYDSVPPIHSLDGVSLSVVPDEILVIVGRSGCGKSTLLGVMAGLYRPTSGQLEIRGKVAHGPQQSVAVVFQEAGLFPWLSVVKNVEFPLRARGIPSAERRCRAVESLKLVGLRDCVDLLPGQLSGGMRQRASIARALCQRAEVLLMDEPFSAIDALSRTELQDLLLELNSTQSLTVVMVTHDLTEAAVLANRIAVMRGGRISEIITPKLGKGPGRRYDPGLGFLQMRLARAIDIQSDIKPGVTGPGD